MYLSLLAFKHSEMTTIKAYLVSPSQELLLALQNCHEHNMHIQQNCGLKVTDPLEWKCERQEKSEIITEATCDTCLLKF
jgi:hypothetical protein